MILDKDISLTEENDLKKIIYNFVGQLCLVRADRESTIRIIIYKRFLICQKDYKAQNDKTLYINLATFRCVERTVIKNLIYKPSKAYSLD